MARHENPNNIYTTISIRKTDKRTLRMLAEMTKETKNGYVYEKDANIFSRILIDYINRYPTMVGEYKPTYPANVQGNNLGKSQRGSSPLVTT